MDDEQYRALMDAISTSKKEVEGKLTENLVLCASTKGSLNKGPLFFDGYMMGAYAMDR